MNESPARSCLSGPINVIVPVYRGVDETARCLKSVVAAGLLEDVFLTIINDASPEPEMLALLDRYAEQRGVTLLHNSANLGFVATANRGMLHRPAGDVVLLNSDTQVPTGWLERLRKCAYAASDIGTVTPFSNNATICSYPRFCSDNEMPAGYSVNTLDELFSRANARQIVDIPSAVGFCMYIRRDCLNEVGLFNEERFGKGYGEENDFSLRAASKGWRNVLCADVFVFHAGAVSFSNERDERARHALGLVIKDHPRYQLLVQTHIAKDPAKHLRHRVDLLRLARSEKQVVLLISHRLGGGVVKHEQELSRLFTRTINFLRLTPGINGQIEITWYSDAERLRLHFRLPTDWQELLAFLTLARVARIHIHHLMDVPKQIEELPKALGVPYDFTAHDYFSFCPRITLTNSDNRYCGEPAEDGCNTCLKNAPAHQRDVRAWRLGYQRILAAAERVFVPSHDTALRLRSRFELANLIVAPHADMRNRESLAPNQGSLHSKERLRIVIIGALSATKGADLLEAVALDAKKRGLLLQFHLIGYAWRALATEPNSPLTVSGSYRDDELPALLVAAKPHLIWFPALWPETYSYTLSAAILAGAPIVAPDLGAFSERLANRPWSWICPWDQSPADWCDFFVHAREAHFTTGMPPLLPEARSTEKNIDWVPIYLMAGKKRPEIPNQEEAVLRFADTHTAPRLPLMRRLSINARGALLRMGLTLRSLPLLTKLVRHIPISWQYRIRDWLVK
jgi:O-antigen biosynthesis protein